jgi:hypothetical protein
LVITSEMGESLLHTVSIFLNEEELNKQNQYTLKYLFHRNRIACNVVVIKAKVK